jgi:hypothetical protein
MDMTNEQLAAIQAHATLVQAQEMAAFLGGYRVCRNCGEYGVDEDPCWRCHYDYETGEIVEPDSGGD